MNKGVKGTVEGLYKIICSPETSIEGAESAGRALWRRGLNIQSHTIRVKNDMDRIQANRYINRNPEQYRCCGKKVMSSKFCTRCGRSPFWLRQK